ncbi:MAG: hypothetical protein ACFB10_18580 [Salibacteraceae bacterium]
MLPPIPEPFLLNVWKHWEPWQLSATRALAEQENGLASLLQHLKTIGGSLMDVYHGPLSFQECTAELSHVLQSDACWEPDELKLRLQTSKGYLEYSLSDAAVWVVRWGEIQGRHLHLHPGRYSRHTYRVKAHTLKTALLALYFHYQEGVPLQHLDQLNQLRTRYLDLSPMRKLYQEKGLGMLLQHWEGKL